MQKVYSSQPIESIAYHRRTNDAEVYLRENISEEIDVRPDGTEQPLYVADEVFIITDLSREEVESRFDELWVKAESRAGAGR